MFNGLAQDRGETTINPKDKFKLMERDAKE